jgi:hypothetical protein
MQEFLGTVFGVALMFMVSIFLRLRDPASTCVKMMLFRGTEVVNRI